jgi:hypothetical protein
MDNVEDTLLGRRKTAWFADTYAHVFVTDRAPTRRPTRRGIATHMKERILKAACIAAGGELFGIGRIAPSAKGPGQCELEVEQTVFAADRTVPAAARRDFCGI